nr:hypothetical protein [Tanacetum cinerariifolium]
MAISTILISSNSSEESVRTPYGGVLWFDMIPTTVPVTTPTIDPPVIHDDTSLIPTETPTISPITSMILHTVPTTHYTSLFIHTNSFDNDTPDTPPSPTHEIPPVETLSDSSLDALSGSPSGYSSLDHSSPALPSGLRYSHQLYLLVSIIPHSSVAITERPSHSSFAGPFCKRSRSSTTSVSISSPIPGALSSTHADLLAPPKMIRSSDFVTNLKVSLDESSESSVLRETSLRDDVIKSIQRDQGHMIITTGHQSAFLSKRISELEWDNIRLRGTLDVTSQRVT